MQHPDEGTIHAWIDGELSQEEATALEAHLAECAECSVSAAEARGLVAASSRIVSALDIVPGGVIPAARAKRRPWYASAQLRAAAAIAIVAGASMLVMRDQKKAAMDSVLTVSAPAPAPAHTPATAEADNPVAQSGVPTTPTANAPAEAARGLAKEKAASTPSRERREDQARQRVAESPPSADAAAPAPPPPATAVAAPLARSAADEAASTKAGKAERDSAQRRFSAQLSDAVVTSVATESAPALKELRSDSSTAVRETTYEAWPGIQVVLTDAAPVTMRKSIAQRAGVGAASSAPRAALKEARINSISWTDKRGHAMTLSGPVSKEQLESIRKLLPEDKR